MQAPFLYSKTTGLFHFFFTFLHFVPGIFFLFFCFYVDKAFHNICKMKIYKVQ